MGGYHKKNKMRMLGCLSADSIEGIEFSMSLRREY